MSLVSKKYTGKRLVLVGSGIKAISQLTKEAIAHLSQADLVLTLVNDPITLAWVKRYSKSLLNLQEIYFSQPKRKDAYTNITTKIISSLDVNDFVCVLIYGHPTVFAHPGLDAIHQVAKLGCATKIIPGVSAEDCLYADLNFNPGSCGCYSVEASDFILYDRCFDNGSHLIIWQIGMIGNLSHERKINIEALENLKNKLLKQYPKSHQATLYEAAIYPGIDSQILHFPLNNLENQKMTALTTLYLPPVKKRIPKKNIQSLLNL